jgi:hypothetical protein
MYVLQFICTRFDGFCAPGTGLYARTCPAVWTRTNTLIPTDTAERYRFRQELLARAAKLCSSARETNVRRLERYKRIYDYYVRNRHKDLRVGDQVLVKTFALEPGRSSKLTLPVAGPYPIYRIEGSNVDIRTKEGNERLHLDRVIRCPVDLPTGVAWAPVTNNPKPTRPRKNPDEDAEYMIDRFVSHARDEGDNMWLIRVRWAGFSSAEDTWEPASEMPETLLRKYERRKTLVPWILSHA